MLFQILSTILAASIYYQIKSKKQAKTCIVIPNSVTLEFVKCLNRLIARPVNNLFRQRKSLKSAAKLLKQILKSEG